MHLEMQCIEMHPSSMHHKVQCIEMHAPNALEMHCTCKCMHRVYLS